MNDKLILYKGDIKCSICNGYGYFYYLKDDGDLASNIYQEAFTYECKNCKMVGKITWLDLVFPRDRKFLKWYEENKEKVVTIDEYQQKYKTFLE